MSLVQRADFCARSVLLLVAAAGCSLSKSSVQQSSPSVQQGSTVQVARLPAPQRSAQALPRPARQPELDPPQGQVQQVALRVPATPDAEIDQMDGLFAGQQELSLEMLIAEVQARNPSLQAMTNAWRAAAQRYPQVITLDDPMFAAAIAPDSFGAANSHPAYFVDASQKLPWFGKLRTRGQGALAETSAAYQDVQDVRLVISLVTRLAFFDYYLAERQLEINGRNLQSAQDFRDTARVKYENKQVDQQDVIQADVELSDLRRRKIELVRMRGVAIARINTLLLRPPGAQLQRTPQSLALEASLPSAGALQQTAVAARPDLAAIGARVRAEQAAVDLAFKQYYPDTEVSGRYDAFWAPDWPHAAQVGVRMNVPIYRRRLNAAVREAQFRLSQRRAEYQQRLIDIQYEVQSAYEQVEEARRAAELYSTEYLPFAEQNLAVARANYDVGKGSFLIVVTAQRQVFAVRERYEQALADYYRRLADLERAVGGTLPAAAQLEELPPADAQQP